MERRGRSMPFFAVVAALVAGCLGVAPAPTATIAPGPTPLPTPEANNRTVTAFDGPMPPAGNGMRIDLASISADRTVVTVSFVGGPPFDPADPCSNHYVAWAQDDGDGLALDLEEQSAGAPASPDTGCSLVGYVHTYRVILRSAFKGSHVDGIPLVPPGPMPLLTAPPGWAVQLSFRSEAGPPVIWAQTYGDQPVTEFSGGFWPGPIDLYQGFPNATDLLSANEQAQNGATPQRVLIDGHPTTLWLRHDLPRYIVAWTLEGRDLAISADSNLFTADQVVQLANGVTPPG